MPARILIADDNPIIRTTLRQLLAGLGELEISEAEDGQQAVIKAQQIRPSVAILDLAMPVMDGLTAAREISKILPEIPVFLCTMYWSPHLEREAKKFGVWKVISKAKSDVLLSSIRELLDSGSPKAVPGSAQPGVKILAATGCEPSSSVESGAIMDQEDPLPATDQLSDVPLSRKSA